MKNKLVVDGLTRLNGDAKVFGDLKLPNLTNTTNPAFFLTTNTNGKVMSIDKGGLLAELYQPDVYCLTDINGFPAPPFWSNSSNVGYGILYTGTGIGCPARIGIGTDSPITTLDVRGKIAMSSGATTGFIPVSDANGVMSWTDPATIGTGSVWHTNNTQQASTPNDIYFSAGNVSIGTTKTADANTIYKLSVAGDVRAESVEVSLETSWPDYVFEKDYQLSSLAEIESYITKNNHLPNVPSQKEIKEEGLNLGEMDAILLKKIEELTLYVIDLKKENTELRSLINEK